MKQVLLSSARHGVTSTGLLRTLCASKEPVELVFPIQQYRSFKHTIKLLFDRDSAKVIKYLARGYNKAGR